MIRGKGEDEGWEGVSTDYHDDAAVSAWRQIDEIGAGSQPLLQRA